MVVVMEVRDQRWKISCNRVLTLQHGRYGSSKFDGSGGWLFDRLRYQPWTSGADLPFEDVFGILFLGDNGGGGTPNDASFLLGHGLHRCFIGLWCHNLHLVVSPLFEFRWQFLGLGFHFLADWNGEENKRDKQNGENKVGIFENKEKEREKVWELFFFKLFFFSIKNFAELVIEGIEKKGEQSGRVNAKSWWGRSAWSPDFQMDKAQAQVTLINLSFKWYI